MSLLKTTEKWGIKLIEKVEGIIISETPYGETSKIINILTKEYGIIGVMAKGAKSMKSKLRAATDRFTYGYFHIYYKPDKLSTLITVDVINSFKQIRSDITLISYLNFIVELTHQVYKQNSDPKLYQLCIQAILKINDGLNPLIITNIIELKYLAYLGVGLNLNACSLCGSKEKIITLSADSGGYICQDCLTDEPIVDIKTIKMLRMYDLVEISSISKIDISNQVQNEINIFINKYYERYTGLYLKSKKFLDSLLS